MNVRSRLALATAIALLALLLTFYIGGRVILLNAFHLVEKEVLRSIPDLIKSIHAEIRQLDQEAAVFPDRSSVVEAFRQRTPSAVEREAPALWMAREDLQLVAFADPTGRVFSAVFLPPGNETPRLPSPSLQQHLKPGMPLLSFSNQTRGVRSGVVVLDEVPMLLAVQRVPEDTAVPAQGFVVLVQ